MDPWGSQRLVAGIVKEMNMLNGSLKFFKATKEVLTAFFFKEMYAMKREIWKLVFRNTYHYVILLP